MPTWTKGAFREAKRLRLLAVAQEIMPGDVVEFGCPSRNVAALLAVMPGKPVEGGDRPVRLGRGQALSDAVPGVIGQRWAFEEDASGLLQILYADARDLCDPFRRIVRGGVRKGLQSGPEVQGAMAGFDVI